MNYEKQFNFSATPMGPVQIAGYQGYQTQSNTPSVLLGNSYQTGGIVDNSKRVLHSVISHVYPVLNTSKYPDTWNLRKQLQKLTPRKGDLMMHMKSNMTPEGRKERYYMTPLIVNYILRYERMVALEFLKRNIHKLWSSPSQIYVNRGGQKKLIGKLIIESSIFKNRHDPDYEGNTYELNEIKISELTNEAFMKTMGTSSIKSELLLQWLQNEHILEDMEKTGTIYPFNTVTIFPRKIFHWLSAALCKKRFRYVGVCDRTESILINGKHAYNVHGVDTIGDVYVFRFFGKYKREVKIGSYWIQHGIGPTQLYIDRYTATIKEMITKLGAKHTSYKIKMHQPYVCLSGQYIGTMMVQRRYRKTSMTNFDILQLFPFNARFDILSVHNEIVEHTPMGKMYTKLF